MSLFGELGRRNVIRVGIAYAIIAWLVVQVADIVLETIGAPAWVMQTLMLLLALGFVVTVIFAWAYEVTPEGIKRESEVDRDASITRVTGRKLDRVITGLLVVALAYFVWEARFADEPAIETPSPPAAVTPAEVDEVLVTPAANQSIAVLPFDNRSSREEDEFFAEGMHDDLLTTLAKIGSMKVISRTSVMEYRDTTKKIPEIARELGVANILEGGVQRSGNHVRINVQLIDAATDEHLWAEIYDRELTAENLFAIQSEISRAIADALHAALSPEEEKRLSTAPTDNLEAFDHYLRGRNLIATRAVDKLQAATQEFLEAVRLDPGFALAWVGVADAHNLLAWYSGAPYGTYFDIRDRAINRALEIDPKLGEAYASLGTLMEHQGKLDAAEEAYRTAIRYSPNYATAYHWLSNAIRGNSLRFQEALTYAVRAAELDPNSAIILSNLSTSYFIIGDLEDSNRYTARLLESHPDFAHGYSQLATLRRLQGDIVGAVEAQRKVVELDPDSASELSSLITYYADVGAFTEAERTLHAMQERFPAHPLTTLSELLLARATGKPADVRAQVARVLHGKPAQGIANFAAYVALSNRDFDLAYDAFDQTYAGMLGQGEISDEFLRAALFDACALAEVLRETDGSEARGDALLERSIAMYEDVVKAETRIPEIYFFHGCYLQAGDTDKAMAELERQLTANLTFNWRWALQSPIFDPVRNDPRFVALQAEYERRCAEQRDLLRSRAQAKPAFEF